MQSVLQSRKFWFSLVLPIAIQTVALLLNVITPTVYIAALTTTTSTYAATVAYEDGQQKKALAEAGATPAQITKA